MDFRRGEHKKIKLCVLVHRTCALQFCKTSWALLIFVLFFWNPSPFVSARTLWLPPRNKDLMIAWKIMSALASWPVVMQMCVESNAVLVFVSLECCKSCLLPSLFFSFSKHSRHLMIGGLHYQQMALEESSWNLCFVCLNHARSS